MAAGRLIVRSRPITVGQTTSPGSGVIISCSADGWVRLILNSGNFVEIFAQAGSSEPLDLQVSGVSGAAQFSPLATNVIVNVIDY